MYNSHSKSIQPESANRRHGNEAPISVQAVVKRPGDPSTRRSASMSASTPGRLPSHIGFIPDGNRRWAIQRGLEKQEGYGHGIPLSFRRR